MIREIDASEFEIVWPIYRAVIAGGDAFAPAPDTPFEEARRTWAEPPARAFVATEAGAVLGSYMLRPNQPGLGDHVANAGYIVAPKARGRGLARTMCEHSLETARVAGFTAMQFNYVVATNTGAIKVWERCGFKVVGRVPKAFRHATLGPVDVLVMHRFL
ncbi:MAG TPA: GNAT family N-acetyltransferase [Candidatus Polarisedimenticolaceae bacterium]|nr:GNAT family N-acetyltransferase [Candidatus Polarisedimenticolaceae bacterium]